MTAATTGGIAWQWGDQAIVFHGGWNRGGRQSTHELRPIVTLAGRKPDAWVREELPLTNALLFRRDRYICAYCGDQFSLRDLSCDHVIPRVQGGRDIWTNVVTACHATSEKVVGGPRRQETCSCCSYPMHRACGSTSSCLHEESWPIRWSFWQPGYQGIVGHWIGSPSEPAQWDDGFKGGRV